MKEFWRLMTTHEACSVSLLRIKRGKKNRLIVFRSYLPELNQSTGSWYRHPSRCFSRVLYGLTVFSPFSSSSCVVAATCIFVPRCHKLGLPINRVVLTNHRTRMAHVSSGNTLPWPRRSVWVFRSYIASQNISLNLLLYRELLVGMVVSAIAVFRLVDNILSCSLHC